MKFLYIILFTLLYLQGFCQEIFEGVIKYSVNVELYQENHPWNNYLAKKWGDTLVVYHDDSGSYKKEYLGSEPLGLDWNFYNKKENNFYTKYYSMDTIFYYSCSTITFNFISLLEGDSITIKGQQYPSIVLEFSNPKGEETAKEICYYDPELKLDPKNYLNFKDGFLDKIYQKTKAHFIQWSIEEKGLYKATFTAVEIKREKVNLSDVEFDKNLPLKRF